MPRTGDVGLDPAKSSPGSERAVALRAGPGPERVAVAATVSAVGAILLGCVLQGLGASRTVAITIAGIMGMAATVGLAGRMPERLDGSLRRSRLLAALWLALAVVTVGVTGRLAGFMVDESKGGLSMLPADPFFVQHSCLTSYYQGARFQLQGVPNVYERTLYEGADGEPHFIGTITIDPYQYPPTFLLLPRLGLLASSSFPAWRTVWFGLEGVIVALALGGVAMWIGGALGLRAGLLALLVWTSLPTLVTLQTGNFQLVAIAVAVLARIAIDRGHIVPGGALLALVSVAKMFPAVLILELLFRRRWRAVAWTAGFAVAFVALARGVLGAGPFQSFISYQVPRLASGAAFETIFVHPDAVACSHAIFAIVQKLGLIGIPGMSLGLAAIVTSLYTFVLIGASWLGARAGDDRWTQALVWLALLQLASLRSPFVPDVYAQFALLWIVTLLLARGAWRPAQVAGLVLAVILLQKIVPTTPLPPIPALAALTLLHQLVFIGLCVWILAAAPRRAEVVGHRGR